MRNFFGKSGAVLGRQCGKWGLLLALPLAVRAQGPAAYEWNVTHQLISETARLNSPTGSVLLHGFINAIVRQPDGKILIAGSFDFSGHRGPNIVRLNADGSRDGSFTIVDAPMGTVTALVLQPDGKILLGLHDDTAPLSTGVVRLNADGSRDATFASQQPGPYRHVTAMAQQPDGKVLVAGRGERNAPHRYALRLMPDGAPDATFASAEMPAGQLHVEALALLPDGSIVVGGPALLARLGSDGVRDSTFAPHGAALPTATTALVALPDGQLLVGGRFGTSRTSVVRLAADGTRDANYKAPDLGRDSRVQALAVQADGQLLVGTAFSIGYDAEDWRRLSRQEQADISRRREKQWLAQHLGMVRLAASGARDQRFALSPAGLEAGVGAWTVLPDDRLLASGHYVAAPGGCHLLRLFSDGTPDKGFAP